MKYAIFILVFAWQLGCSSANHAEEVHKSTTGKYVVEVYVGDRNEVNDKYILTLRLINEEGAELDYLNTRASDIMKWAIVWDNHDNLILDSHDIGTLAWAVKENRLQPTLLTEEMKEIARAAFDGKYN